MTNAERPTLVERLRRPGQLKCTLRNMAADRIEELEREVVTTQPEAKCDGRVWIMGKGLRDCPHADQCRRTQDWRRSNVRIWPTLKDGEECPWFWQAIDAE